MRVCVYAYVCMRVCVYICVYACMCVCVYPYACMHVCMYAYACMRVCLYPIGAVRYVRVQRKIHQNPGFLGDPIGSRIKMPTDLPRSVGILIRDKHFEVHNGFFIFDLDG